MRARRSLRSWSCLLLGAFAALPLGAETFWTTDGVRLTAFAIDFQTGATHLAMPGISDPTQRLEFTAAATDPLTGILWVFYRDLVQARNFLGRLPVGTTQPEEVLLLPLNPTGPVQQAEFSPSGLLYLKLWGPVLYASTLATFDPATRVMTPVIEFAPDAGLNGLSFNPHDGKLYITGYENCGEVCVNFIDTLTIPQHQRSRVWQSIEYGPGEPLFSDSGEMLTMAGEFYRPVDNTLHYFSDPVSYPTPFGPQIFIAYGAARAEGTEGCVPSFSRACLQKRRFAIDATYDASIFGGSAGDATPLVERDESLRFSFFAPGNLELFLKIVDGCSYNGHFWLFFSGLTNVGVSLRITDTSSGEVYSYDNPPGTTFVPVLDIQAFACAP